MSNFELFNIPAKELYWRKESITDQIFIMENKLKRLKNAVKIEQTKENIIGLYNDIKQINSRMNALYM